MVRSKVLVTVDSDISHFCDKLVADRPEEQKVALR